jgi:signal transduction histidine kinase
MKLFHSLFLSDFAPETIIFAVIGNVLWIAIYVLLVKHARKNEFVEMPLFILIGNMVWEGLYGFVLPVESALSPVLQWGTKGWFILDCFIFAFALRYAQNSISTPIILRHIKSVSLALIVLWGALVYAIAFDGGPVVGMDEHHVMDKGFVRETKSAFLLGIIISVTYIFQYLHLYQQRVFLPSVAWLKLFGNAAATIAIAFYRPFNELLVVLGVLTFISDVFYVALRFILPNTVTESTPPQTLQASDYVFPPNPAFEELWAKNPEYLESNGLKLRRLRLPHWSFELANYSLDRSVLEGAIMFTVHSGMMDAEAVRCNIKSGHAIMDEMGWDILSPNLTMYCVDDLIKVSSVSAGARRFSKENHLQYVHVTEQFLVLSGLIGNVIMIGQKLARYVIAETSGPRLFFLSVDDALTAMLNLNFSRSGSRTPDPQEILDPLTADTSPYHQERIKQLYILLSKIESLEVVEHIPIPEIPDDDIYADVFQALVMVLDDKKAQIQQARSYTQELERQANQIQLVNNELFQQNQELSVLNAEKEEFMGILAHDLKNPIGAMRLFAELIENQTFTGDEIPPIAGQMVHTSDRMLALVKNLLEMNRFESGGVQMSIAALDIATLAEAVTGQYTSPAEAKNITLHFSNEAENSIALADEQALAQVLDNLVSNAVKYSPHGKNVFVRVKSSSEAVCVEIQDQGPGISAEDQTKLFGKFARLTAQPTGGEHSTGLGLSIVKKMVEAMGGEVWCESELGKGAMFVVELPAITENNG